MSKLAEHVVCQGVDPAWQLKLTRGPDMKQFNERFVHEKIMVKEYLGTSVRQVKMKKSCRSISAALLACKCYKWGEACGCAGGFQHQGVAGLAACGERATARGCMQRSRSSHTPLSAQADLCREAIIAFPAGRCHAFRRVLQPPLLTMQAMTRSQ